MLTNLRRFRFLLYAAMIVIAVILRIAAFSPGLEYDEIWTIRHYSARSIFVILNDLATPNNHPLNSLAVRGMLFFSYSPESIRLPYESQNEGISHKCGHDGHCAVLCGLALELDSRETERDVYLIFQPGEEIGAGAKRCAELIREKGIAEIYAMHNLGGYPEGSLVYRRGLTQPASEGLRIRLTGKTSHASAPEKGNNPAGTIASIVQYALCAAELTGQELHDSVSPPAQTPLSDTKNKITPVIQNLPMRLCTITGIRLGGGDFGISPGRGEIRLTLRAEAEEEMLAMEQSIISYAAQVSAAAGLEMTYSVHDYFPETRNHDDCLDRVLDAARENKIPAISMQELWRASEDFGHYLKICPGAMFYIGNGEDYAPLHTAEYDFNDRIIETAVNMFMGIIGIPSAGAGKLFK